MNQFCRLALLMVAAGALALSACGKPQAPASKPAAKPSPVASKRPPAPPATLSVSSVQLGNALDADGMVSSNGLTFAPNDKIYAVVLTDAKGKPDATLVAKWTYGDQDTLINSSDQKITTGGMMITTFHISKPSGFPTGNYKLQVSVNGKVESTINFDVE